MEQEKQQENRDGECHWIIMRDDGKAIFGGIYPDSETAQAEVSFHNLSGYHLECRQNQFKKKGFK